MFFHSKWKIGFGKDAIAIRGDSIFFACGGGIVEICIIFYCQKGEKSMVYYCQETEGGNGEKKEAKVRKTKEYPTQKEN